MDLCDQLNTLGRFSECVATAVSLLSKALPLATAASLKGAAAQLQLTEPAYYYGYRLYFGYHRPYYR